MGRAFYCIVTIGVTLCGCVNLPDTQPFTSATVGLRSAVASSGAATVAELKLVNISGVKTEANNLEGAWAERNKLFSGLVQYADSLQAIVESGKKGAESAKALADSVQQLAQVANLVQPGAGPAIGVAAQTAQYVYGEIAKVRAAKSLEQALAHAQPAVEAIAAKMAMDMDDLDKLIRAADKAQRDEITTLSASDIGYRKQLLATRANLMATIQTKLQNTAPSAITERAELDEANTLIAATDSWNESYQAQLDAINERERLSRQLVAETKTALNAWASEHAEILRAVRTKRVPSATEIVEAAKRIQDLVEQYKNL